MSRSRKRKTDRPVIRAVKPDVNWRPFFVEQIYHMTRVGATLDDVAEAFGVTNGHLHKWLAERPEMAEALERGRTARNDRVVSSLFAAATGYSHETEKIFCNPKGEVTRVPFTEKFPPNPGACMFWLKNRERGRWADLARFEHTGEGGGAIKIEELVTQAEEVGKRIRGLTFNEAGDIVEPQSDPS